MPRNRRRPKDRADLFRASLRVVKRERDLIFLSLVIFTLYFFLL